MIFSPPAPPHSVVARAFFWFAPIFFFSEWIGSREWNNQKSYVKWVVEYANCIKNPKLYFYDAGLVSSLLGITSAGQIENFYMRGALFENFVVSEILKKKTFYRKDR